MSMETTISGALERPDVNSKENFLLNSLFVSFWLPLLLTFHFDKVYDIFIHTNLRGLALFVLNRIDRLSLVN